MTTISAKTILRSRNTSRPDKVLSTLLLRYPRCIHSEFMTHRMLSKNSASSRAIPVSKLIKDVEADPYIPLVWGKNQAGMQAYEECVSKVDIDVFSEDDGWTVAAVSREEAWLEGMKDAMLRAKRFDNAGYHKQIINRILEPYAHITVVCSGTEWSNFLGLRDHSAAEPHIQILAAQIRDCLESDPIQDLEPGQWHLPFIDNEFFEINSDSKIKIIDKTVYNAIKLAVARCASTSYKTVEGFDMTLEKAIEIHDKLVGSIPLHASPCEHVAYADQWSEEEDDEYWHRPDLHGNFVGFCQYRKTLPNESL